MKGKGIIAILACGTLLLAGTSANATYTSIVHNLLNGVNDTTFTPGTGEFKIDSTATNTITLNDPPPGVVPGVVSNSHVLLTTTFDSVVIIDGTPYGKFLGGNFELTFDFDPTGAAPLDSHEISGPITALFFTVTDLGSIGRLDGLGRWTATTVDLPSNNYPAPGVWPAVLYSSIDSLSISFNDDLSDFDWTRPLNGRVESQYTLFPTDAAIPEPGSLALLALGVVGLLRRR